MPFNYTHIVTEKEKYRSNAGIGGIYVRSNFRRYYRKSVWFDRGDKTKNFDLFSEGCGFTDDSVMTIAVGEALLAAGPEAAVKKIEDAVASNMQDWGKRYPHAGYGGSFRHWLKENNPKPYGSYGNGGGMRVESSRLAL